MADEQANINRDRAAQLAEMNKQGALYVDILKQQKEAVQELANQGKLQLGDQQAFTSNQKAALDLARSLATVNVNDLKNRTKRQTLEKKMAAAKQSQFNLEKKISALTAQQTDDALEQAVILKDALDTSKALVKEARKLSNEYRKLDSAVRAFEAMADFVEDVPILRKVFPEFKKAAEAARDAFAEGEGFASSMLKGFNQLGGVVLKGLITTIITGVSAAQERLVGISREFGIANDLAAKIDANVVSTGIGFKQALQSTLAFGKAMGFVGDIGQELTRTTAVLQNRMGLSAEAAGGLYDAATLSGQSLQDFTDNLIGAVKVQNTLNDRGYSYQEVMQTIGDASEMTRLQISKFPGGIAQAAFQARKLGLSFANLNSASSGLLDFQSSIESELEAELLTGKQLNLQRARELALKGDLAGLAQEITEQVGSEEEFLAMNVLQQEAIAKAVGMSREELAKSFNIRRRDASLAKLTASEDYKKLDLEKKVRALKAKGLTEEEAYAAVQKEIGEDEFNRQLNRETAEEKMAQLLEKVADILGKKLLPAFEKMTNFMGGLEGSVDSLANGFLFLAGAAVLGKVAALIGKISKGIKGIKGFFGKGGGKSLAKEGTEQAAKVGAEQVAKKGGGKLFGKIAGKFAGKGALKRIPILGSLMGVGFAIDRLIKGDYAGAAMEAGSAGLGLLDLIAPGLGTGLSLAADAGIAARDLKKAGTITPTANDNTGETALASGGIVRQPTRALVGEAGAEAVVPLNEFYAKMDELINVVKSGGDVFLDGRKVGESLALSYNNQ